MYTNGMCRYHGGVLSQYVCAHRLHHTSPILPDYRIAFVADLLNVFTCSMNHHTTGSEHLMSTVEKKIVSLYSITM